MFMNELPELDNIIDTIRYEDCAGVLSFDEQKELVETSMDLINEYIDNNPTAITEPDFHEEMIENIIELLEYNPMFDNCKDEINIIVEFASEMFYDTIMPERSEGETFETDYSIKEHSNITKKLSYLESVPQSTQRTRQWYKTRHNLITASNAYKAFESQSNQNQLIYEKCLPLLDIDTQSDTFKLENVNTTLHWGQKYEPISTMYYEMTYNTKITDYGCIPHQQHTFLGASPDGIVTNIDSPRYGRMLEIKNIVNREIDGIPKKEYWVQMQLQMENCDLDECDFLETKFVEYENVEQFNDDGTFLKSVEDNLKGIIMYFSGSTGKPVYIYKPLDMNEKDFNTWEESLIEEEENKGNTWIRTIYWKLEIVSCVLVLRNKRWFKDNINQLQEIWETIEKERISGYEHRKPNKRIKKETTNTIVDEQQVLIHIDKETGEVVCNTNLENNNTNTNTNNTIEPFFRIRTESIDEAKNNYSLT